MNRLLTAAESVMAMDPDKIFTKVTETVVGQDARVGEVVDFLFAATARVAALAGGASASEVPANNVLLIMGPTGSGKTLTVRTACEAMGLGYREIDGAQLTGAGWHGADLDAELKPVAQDLKGDPRPYVVFIDEADKLSRGDKGKEEGFDPSPVLLRLLEATGEHPVASSDSKASFTLDADALVFVMAGAFTGIDRQVRARLRGGAGAACGFAADADAQGAAVLPEDEARALAGPADLEAWGMPRELVGRVSTVVSLRPLGESAFREILDGGPHSVRARYQRIVPEGVEVAIDGDAATELARRAAEAGLGARGLLQAVGTEMNRAVAHAVADRTVVGVRLFVGKLGPEAVFENDVKGRDEPRRHAEWKGRGPAPAEVDGRPTGRAGMPLARFARGYRISLGGLVDSLFAARHGLGEGVMDPLALYDPSSSEGPYLAALEREVAREAGGLDQVQRYALRQLLKAALRIMSARADEGSTELLRSVSAELLDAGRAAARAREAAGEEDLDGPASLERHERFRALGFWALLGDGAQSLAEAALRAFDRLDEPVG